MKRLVLLFSMLLAASVLAGVLVPAAARADVAGPGSGVRIVVPAHDIARGEIIADSDLVTVTVAGSALTSSVVTSMSALTGMQARRMLRAGETLRGEDVRRPVIVAKGQAVTMIFSAPGVELTAMGRAMSEGGAGDLVTVQNPVSYRMITGTVTAPGTVRAIGGLSSSTITARK